MKPTCVYTDFDGKNPNPKPAESLSPRKEKRMKHQNHDIVLKILFFF